MEGNIVKIKSYAFAIRIVNLYKYLINNRKEYVLSKQILRSGTSIGANVAESIGGRTEKDFSSKLSIAYKEAKETMYWIELLGDTGYIDEFQTNSLLYDCEEICKIIGKTQTTLKNKYNLSNIED